MVFRLIASMTTKALGVSGQPKWDFYKCFLSSFLQKGKANSPNVSVWTPICLTYLAAASRKEMVRLVPTCGLRGTRTLATGSGVHKKKVRVLPTDFLRVQPRQMLCVSSVLEGCLIFQSWGHPAGDFTVAILTNETE